MPPLHESLPARPVPYGQLYRGPRYRWWRHGAALGIFLAGLFAFVLVTGILFETVGNAQDPRDPWGFLATNLSLAFGILWAFAVAAWGYRTSPGFVASVAGTFRWHWALVSLVVSAAVMVPALVISSWWEGELSWNPIPQWWLWVGFIVLSTPLQCAGEEFFARGMLSQSVGALFQQRILSALSGFVVSAGVFALLHGSLDPWILGALLLTSAAFSVLTWRTGGIEAAVALHTVNNVTLFLLSVAAGDMGRGLIDASSKGTPEMLLIEAVTLTTVTGAVLWFHQRSAGVATTAVLQYPILSQRRVSAIGLADGDVAHPGEGDPALLERRE